MGVDGDDPFVVVSRDDGVSEVDHVQREVLRVGLEVGRVAEDDETTADETSMATRPESLSLLFRRPLFESDLIILPRRYSVKYQSVYWSFRSTT